MAMGRDQGLNVLQQQICDVESDEQKFICEGNQITPVKDSGLCVTASGNTIFFSISLLFLIITSLLSNSPIYLFI